MKKDKTFNISIAPGQAWILRDRILPGPVVARTQVPPELRGILHELRGKINSAILRFVDEENLERVDIPITPNEGWIIDQTLAYDTTKDQTKGGQTDLLIQVIRGLWGAEYDLPSTVSEDPWQEWDKDSFSRLLGEDDGEIDYSLD